MLQANSVKLDPATRQVAFCGARLTCKTTPILSHLEEVSAVTASRDQGTRPLPKHVGQVRELKTLVLPLMSHSRLLTQPRPPHVGQVRRLSCEPPLESAPGFEWLPPEITAAPSIAAPALIALSFISSKVSCRLNDTGCAACRP